MTNQATALFLACILLFLSAWVRSRPEGFQQQFPHPNSSKETNENEVSDIRQQAIENFKLEVLKKLKMRVPPTGNLTNHFPSTKITDLLQEEEQEISRSDKKENIIVHPINNDFTCQRGNGTFCRKFDFHISSDLESIITLHAYFHKMQLDEKLILSVYDPDSFDDDPLIKLREDSVKNKANSEWISFDLPKKLALETDDNHLLCSVEIEGSDISIRGEESPFLVVTKHTELIERKKREIEYVPSNENCTCCEHIYHVTLEDIGWENWVYAPTSFDIKVCRGECVETLSHFTLSYTHMIRSFYTLNPSLPKPNCLLKPQCKAENRTSLLMFFSKQNGEIGQVNMENMIIKNCKCMFTDL